MSTIEKVRAIADPEKRVAQAARINKQAQERADEARVVRDRAAVSLHLHYDWKPVEVYRALGVSRSLFVRMIERVTDGGRKALGKVPDAERAMKRAAKTVERNDALVEESRLVRDEAAEGMLNGRYRKPGGGTYRNAEVARLTHLTTARVAQLRKGTR